MSTESEPKPNFDFSLNKFLESADEVLVEPMTPTPTEAPKKKRGRPPKPKTPPMTPPPTKTTNPLETQSITSTEAFKDAVDRVTSRINTDTNKLNNTETPPSKEEVEKSKVLSKINRLYNFFPHLVDPKIIPNLSWTITKLTDEYKRCREQLKTKDCLQNMKRLDLVLNAGLEYALIAVGMDARNLALHAATTQDDRMEELMELSVEYDNWLGQSLEFRYITSLLSGALQFIQIKKKSTVPMSQEEVEGFVNKYSDL